MSLDPLLDPWLVLAVAIALGTGCFWLARRTLSVSPVATAGALLAIACWLGLVLRPSVPVARPVRQVAVWTPGGGAPAQRAAAGAYPPRYRLETEAVGGHRTGNAPDLGWVLRRHPGLAELTVLGGGLEGWELAEFGGRVYRGPLGSTDLDPTGSEGAAGWIAVDWERRIELGSPLVVRGRIARGSGTAVDAPVEIGLTAPGGVSESVRANPDGTFRLSVVPATEGRLLYRLRFRSDEGQSAEEIVDVVVGPRRAPRLLWLEASPSFESRHVEAWLGELGGGLAIRSQLAPGIARVVERGLVAPPEGELRPGLLADVDLLVVDLRSLERLAGQGSAGRAALEEAVFRGLGLVVRVEDEVERLPSQAALLGPFAIDRPAADASEATAVAAELSAGNRWAVRLLLPDLPAGAGVEPLDLPARELALSAGAWPVLADRAGRVLVGAHRVGRGSVLVTLVDGTYRWLLAGQRKAHRAYWTALLAEAARPLPRVPSIRLASGPVQVDQPLDVAVWSESSEPSLVLSAEGEVPVGLALRPDPRAAGRWQGLTWPRREGWQCLETGEPESAEPACFFAQPAASWKSLGASRRLRATALRVAADATRPAPAAAATDRVARASGRALPETPLPSWLFFVLFLAGIALAWTATGG